eukprot:scaffold5016_cov118-Isochrysis_galbana.AAC.3
MAVSPFAMATCTGRKPVSLQALLLPTSVTISWSGSPRVAALSMAYTTRVIEKAVAKPSTVPP